MHIAVPRAMQLLNKSEDVVVFKVSRTTCSYGKASNFIHKRYM